MNIKHIWLALMFLCMASCSEKENMMLDQPKQEVRVTAGIGTQSRVALSDNGEHTLTHWQDGDQIMLFTNSQSNLMYSTSFKHNTSAAADFTAVNEALENIEGNTVYACYPNASLVSEGGKVVELPSTEITDYSTDKLRAFGYAVDTISNGYVNFAFQHLCAFLCLTESAETIAGSRIMVTTTSDQPLSIDEGDTFDFATLTASLTHGSDTVWVIVDSETTDETKMVYIPILPQPADAAITITVTNSEGKMIFTQTKKAPATGFVPGNVYKVKTTLQEREKLINLYNYTNGDNWTNNTNWGTSAPLSEWYGITTDEYGWVTSIDLSNNNLTNEVEIDLNNFSCLTSINLDNNNLYDLGIIGSAGVDSISLNSPATQGIHFENFKYVEIDCESLNYLDGSCDSLKVSNCDFGDKNSTPFSRVEVKDAVIYNCTMHSCGISSETLLFESSSTTNTWHCRTTKKLSIINSTCWTICGGDFNDDTMIELVDATLVQSNWDEASNITVTKTITGAEWDSLFREEQISENYYLIGDPSEWSPTCTTMPFSHSDKDVSEDPVFSIEFPVSDGEYWFAVIDDITVAAGSNWEYVFGCAEGNGNNGEEGTLKRRYDLSDDGSFKVLVNGDANFIRMTINVKEYTYKIEKILTLDDDNA